MITVKIVINALQYKKNSSGIGVMIRDLFGPYTKIAGHPCQIILTKDAPAFRADDHAECVRVSCKYEQSARRMFFQTFQFGPRYCKDAVLITTDSKMPLILPKDCTAIPLVTDLAVYRMKEAYQLSRVLWWRLQYWFVRRRANFFLTISEFTKQEMMRIWGIPADKIHIVPCACSKELKRVTDAERLTTLRKKYDLPEHFLLFVGNFNPRKNLERLIRAYDLARDSGKVTHQLVIAGEQGWKFDRQTALQGITHQDDVRFIGFVPDEDMAALYSASDAFLFPTLYEGFGIPVIEAQSCGTPVLTSNVSSLPEVGGDAAVYVDPYNVESICNGMEKIVGDAPLAQELRQKGYENAKRFSWEKSAEKLRDIIEREAVR